MRVLVVCPGLEHARRGFESFARECFEELQGAGQLQIELVKGTGPRGVCERSIPTLRRDTNTARWLARASGLAPFVVEHLTFSVGLIPLLLRRRPEVVYFSEWHVGRALAAWRAVSRQRVKLVMCNGSSSPGPYSHLDRVQHLTPGALQWVLDRGADPSRNVALPLGVRIPRRLQVLPSEEREALRRRLNLPTGRRIVISVAALNRQKRIDYLVEELAAMPDPRPFLLLAGAEEEETPALRRLATAKLGPNGFSIRTVARQEVADLTRASDVFVLASLWEGLPRALIEAMAVGIPCIASTHPSMEYALGGHGLTGDLEQPGALRELLARIDREVGETAAGATDRHRFAYERFSWDVLRPRYVEFLRSAAASRRLEPL